MRDDLAPLEPAKNSILLHDKKSAADSGGGSIPTMASRRPGRESGARARQTDLDRERT